MTEQQEVQPSAAASVADNKQPGQKVNNKKSSSGAVVGGIAILLALGDRRPLSARPQECRGSAGRAEPAQAATGRP